MKAVRILWRGLRLCEHLITGALLSLLFNREARGDRPARNRPALVRWWHRRLCRILAVEIATRGRPAEAALMTANHVSWLDIPVLGSACTAVFLSKKEVRSWPLVGWLAGAAGTLFIRRGGNEVRRVTSDIGRHLEDGKRVVLFPEGTTTDGRSVRPFHPRLFAAAMDGSHPLQPVALRYFHGDALDPVAPFVGDESFRHHLWRILGHDATRVEVVFCPPLLPPFAHLGRRDLAAQARATIVANLPAVPSPDPTALAPEDPLVTQEA